MEFDPSPQRILSNAQIENATIRDSSDTLTPRPMPTGLTKGQYADRFGHVHPIDLINLAKLCPPAILHSSLSDTHLQAASFMKVGDEVIHGKAEIVAQAPDDEHDNVLQIGVRSSPVRPSLI